MNPTRVVAFIDGSNLYQAVHALGRNHLKWGYRSGGGRVVACAMGEIAAGLAPRFCFLVLPVRAVLRIGDGVARSVWPDLDS